MKIFRTLALVTAVAFALPALAQTAAPQASASSDMEILKDKIRADKKLLVAQNMQLSDAEAKGFWPVYDDYQKGLAAINQRTGKVINDYADALGKGALTDATAKKLRDESIAIEESEVKMKRDFAPRLDKAVGAVKAARYQQIENKIRAVIKYELAAGIPLAN